MKQTGLLLALLCGHAAQGQQFYAEDFEAAHGYGIVQTGANGMLANTWTVSNGETGFNAGNCGGHGGASKSLHLGANPFFNASGAVYVASLESVTGMRAESPLIDCSGKKNISLSFSYIESGEGSDDNFLLQVNTGSGWHPLSDPGKTATCAAAQGLWTSYTVNLPASANNNARVQIGFVWVNDGDSIGTFPSAAVDFVALTSSFPTPVSLAYFSGIAGEHKNDLHWEAACGSAFTECVVERAPNGKDFEQIGLVPNAPVPAGCSAPYHFTDSEPLPGNNYYRLRFREAHEEDMLTSIVILAAEGNAEFSVTVAPVPVVDVLRFFIGGRLPPAEPVMIQLSDMAGHVVRVEHGTAGAQVISIPVEGLASGSYIAKVLAAGQEKVLRVTRR